MVNMAIKEALAITTQKHNVITFAITKTFARIQNFYSNEIESEGALAKQETVPISLNPGAKTGTADEKTVKTVCGGKINNKTITDPGLGFGLRT